MTKQALFAVEKEGFSPWVSQLLAQYSPSTTGSTISANDAFTILLVAQNYSITLLTRYRWFGVYLISADVDENSKTSTQLNQENLLAINTIPRKNFPASFKETLLEMKFYLWNRNGIQSIKQSSAGMKWRLLSF